MCGHGFNVGLIQRHKHFRGVFAAVYQLLRRPLGDPFGAGYHFAGPRFDSTRRQNRVDAVFANGMQQNFLPQRFGQKPSAPRRKTHFAVILYGRGGQRDDRNRVAANFIFPRAEYADRALLGAGT